MEKRKGCERKYGKVISKKIQICAGASESVGEKKIETVFPQSARLYLRCERDLLEEDAEIVCFHIHIDKNLCIICF